ncbi:MAG TPA: O-antigen ligase family protein [Candidatus Portnoybacteria bacterium]|nr:O-antigen ligase family protein [Candidatus Portnoybacteria bacterium]
MFYSLHLVWQLILLGLGLAAFAVVSWRWPKASAWLVIFLAPLYLLKINSWPITVLEALIWLFVGAWLVKKIINHEINSQWIKGYSRNFILAIILVLIGVFLASVFSADWRVSFGILKAYFIAPLAFCFVLGSAFKKENLLNLFFSALFASSGIVAAISLFFLFFNQLTFDGRLSSFYLSPNHLAMWLVPGLLAGVALWPAFKKNYQKSLWLIVYVLLLAILYFTYSYGAWLGLGAALIFLALVLGALKGMTKKQWLVLFGGALLLGSLVLASQLFGAKSEKLLDIFSSPRSSWQSRLMVWQAALEILKDNWFLGVGPGLFQKYYLAYQQYFSVPYLEWAVPQPHNLFLAWWLQAGLAGLVGFFWLIIGFFKQIKRVLLKIPSLPEVFLMAIMVFFLMHGLIDTPFWKNDLALIFWLVIFLGYKAGHRAC